MIAVQQQSLNPPDRTHKALEKQVGANHVVTSEKAEGY